MSAKNATAGKPDQVLDDSLARLEACLETPVVSGELEAWAAAIDEALEPVRSALQQVIQQSHPDQFQTIRKENQDLMHQVERLREEDTQLLAAYDEFANHVSQFREGAEEVESHESKLDPAEEVLVKAGIGFIVRVRKQQQALKTWLIEALERDTGIAD